MILYGNEENGKLLRGGKAYGFSDYLVSNGFVLLTKNGDSQKYYIFRKEVSNGFMFDKTTSKRKAIQMVQQGWELLKRKDEEVPTEYQHEEVIINV